MPKLFCACVTRANMHLGAAKLCQLREGPRAVLKRQPMRRGVGGWGCEHGRNEIVCMVND